MVIALRVQFLKRLPRDLSLWFRVRPKRGVHKQPMRMAMPIHKRPAPRAPVQLEASVTKGGSKSPNVVRPDGSDVALSIPVGKTFGEHDKVWGGGS